MTVKLVVNIAVVYPTPIQLYKQTVLIKFLYTVYIYIYIYIYIYKGKAIPLQAWTGPEGSKRLRLPDFITIGT